VTVFRFLRESLGERADFVRVLEWNFDSQPYFVESEYGGPNLAQWADSQGGLASIPLERRLRMLAAVAQTVADAHRAGVLHRDLKPANILVTLALEGDAQIKVADFGSASLIEPSRLQALGITNLGLTQTGAAQSPSLTGTLMYLAPEVLCGQSPTASADIYALGVMLYQLVIGDFRKPLAPGWETGVEDRLLQADIASSVHGDPEQRLASPAELSERLLSIDHRRNEHNRLEQAQRRQQTTARKHAEARARLPWVIVAAVALCLTISVSFHFYRRSAPANPAVKTVAVLPFQNAGSDHSLDFLSLALPDEVATTLSYTRGLSMRPFATTSKYMGPSLDLQKAGREMGVGRVVTGHFLREGNQLQVTLEAVDVEENRLLWRDTLDVPAENLIAMQRQITTIAREGLAPALGFSSFSNAAVARPQNEEAYDLYLQSIALSGDLGPNGRGIAMLEKAVELDPNYPSAWSALALRYYYKARYGGGGTSMMQRCEVALERALAVDPNFIPAGTLLAEVRVERGQLARAYEEADDLVRRRPDSADTHFALSYVLRYAGLLDEAGNQCEVARSLDPHNPAWRSCGAVFEQNGDFKRAPDFFRLDDPQSQWSRTHLIQFLLRQGKEKEAIAVGATNVPGWESVTMLQACAAHRPAKEIAALAGAVLPQEDSELNYTFAAHLAYCGQASAALRLLKLSIEANHCSYPAMDKDPFFTTLQTEPEFAEIRAAGIICQKKFLAERAQMEATRH
jgi:serine/threonine protein kinase/Flp pilus assembly protein TadD